MNACEAEPLCKRMHLYLEIPAEASDEDQLSVDALHSLFQPLIAQYGSTCAFHSSQQGDAEDTRLCIGLRRGTSFDGQYDGLVGLLRAGVFEILDFSDGPSRPPQVLCTKTIEDER